MVRASYPRGLGDSSTQDDNQPSTGALITGAVAGTGGGIVQALHGDPVSGAGTALLSIAPATGPAAPFVAAAGLVAELLGGVFGVGKGCGQTCVAASNTANQVEAAMKQNLAAYQAGQISQSQALQNFDALWSNLVQTCQQIGGPGGANCISDRQQGACKWKDANGCWNWFVGYRTPIEQGGANAAGVSSLMANPLGVAALAAAGLLAVEAFS